jgi:two-component system nitrate/nitrite sensor histidine kinase NarX
LFSALCVFGVISVLCGAVLASRTSGGPAAAGALAVLLLVNGAMMAIAWSALVRRADRIRPDVPDDQAFDEVDRLVRMLGEHPSHPLASAPSPRPGTDLEEHLGCIVQLADLLTAAPPSGFALQKALQSLAATLGVESAALRLSPRARGALRCEALLATGTVPVALAEDRAESVDSSTVVRVHRAADGRPVRCLTVPLRREEETVALLALQAPEAFRFGAEQVRVTRIAAMLMSLALSEVSRGREESRGALLEERAAIARELHDSLAQSLAFLKIQVAQLQVSLRQTPGADGAVQTAAQLRQGVSSAYRQVKELIAAFRVRMGTRGLGQALEEAVEEFSLKGGLAIELDDRLADCRLTVNEEFHLLQVIREALSNIVRHANAHTVTVALSHVQDGLVTAVIDDDGRGFAPDPDQLAHYGLVIMGERAASLGGALGVDARAGGGTRVMLTFTPESAAPERAARGF